MTGRDIVVGLDDSPSGRAALRWAADYARSTGNVLRAVHALDWPSVHRAHAVPTLSNGIWLAPDDVSEGRRAQLTQIFSEIDPAPGWRIEFALGDPGFVLACESQVAQLLVVGTHEHVGFARLVVGSVSHYCLHHAQCPVAVIPASTPSLASAQDADRGEVPSATTARAQSSRPAVGTPDRVVVGVDASPQSRAAARYAVEAARLRGFGLVLVHSYGPPELNLITGDALEHLFRAAQELVADLAAQLNVPPDMKVDTLVEPLSPVELLESAAESAALLVVGQDHLSWLDSLQFGRTASLTAAVAPCPVIVVPGSWPDIPPGTTRPIVVALDGETSAQPALSLAFTEASLRGCPVVALHAAPYSASNEDVVEHHVGIAELIAGWKQDYPDVPVETSVVRGDADATLLAWSRNASALVVGRAHRRGWGTWTRSVARTVLEQAHCPLIIPGRASVSPDLVGGVPRRRPASGARR